MPANQYPPFHSYHYHAHSHAFSGELQRPAKGVIEALAPCTLPLTGGQARAQTGSFQIDQLLSVHGAYSHVSGSKTAEGIFSSQSTAVVEGLNILEVVTADRVVARLASEHAPKEPEGQMVAFGSTIENLRVSGCPVEIEFDYALLQKHKTFDDLRKNLAALQKSGRMAEESHGVILCSLVKSLKVECSGVAVQGHVITVPNFGKIYIGELLIEPGHMRLSMMHLQLGSPQAGLLTAADACINGTHFP